VPKAIGEDKLDPWLVIFALVVSFHFQYNYLILSDFLKAGDGMHCIVCSF